MNPLVSIIVPCYKQAQYLEDALNSVASQSYSNWECIIVNDGSPDNTEVIAQKWTTKDPRFIYIKLDNSGVCAARNTAIEKAKGEFILPLDADDRIGKEYVAKALEAFKNDIKLKVVYCKVEFFGDKKGVWELPDFSLVNLSRCNMIVCSAMYKKSEWHRIGGYDTEMIFGIEDWEFWISILKVGGGVKRLDYIGFYYRIKIKSRQKDLDLKKKQAMLEYISVKHVDFFVKHCGSFVSLTESLDKLESTIESNLNSEKFVIDVFCTKFFGFSIFNKYRRKA